MMHPIHAMVRIEKSAVLPIGRLSIAHYNSRQAFSGVLAGINPYEKVVGLNHQTRSSSVNREQIRLALDSFGRKFFIASENVYVPSLFEVVRKYLYHNKKRASPLRPWYLLRSNELREIKKYTEIYFKDMNAYSKISIFYRAKNDYLKELAHKSWGDWIQFMVL